MWYKNIACRFFGLVTKHACDRRTDGQNYDSQDLASIAASRGKNWQHLSKPVGLTLRALHCTDCSMWQAVNLSYQSD